MKRLALAFAALLVALPAATQTISIDAAADRHAIDPRIYGMNFASTAQLLDLEIPVNRRGGNAETRYNWQQNSSNRAQDWFFESLEGNSATAGGDADAFIQLTRDGNAAPMITIPMIGWVAKLGPNNARTCSYRISIYGAQQYNDWEWFPDCGNGVRAADLTRITNNDPTEANMVADPAFQLGWVQHLQTAWGTAAAGGVRYYLLDNEHSLWHDTHRDVKPTGATMDEIRDRMIAYGGMIRGAEPNAVIVGPEEWGWLGAIMSGYDQQWASSHNQWSNTPDRVAHGGRDYMPWLLSELKKSEYSTGKRVLDLFTVHYYPQSGEFGWTDKDAATLRGLRNRSTRSLWDPTYTDESWIATQMYFIPRMRQWVDDNYPGLPVGITEYNWGGEDEMNGATAQADVLGIFGRERLDVATRWGTPATGSFPYNAYRMYRNYDGAHGKFGDVSVRAQVPDPSAVAAFAAIRSSDRALTVMLINKQVGVSANVTLNLANYTASGAAQRWQLDSGNAITNSGTLTVNASTNLTLPAQSITLLVVPGTTDVTPPTIAVTGATRGGDSKWSFTGTAGDTGGSVASVKYKVSGSSGANGTATGTTSWSVPSITVPDCYASITFTAFDAAGNETAVRRALGTSISPASATYGKNAVSGSFAVKAPAGCAWGAYTTDSFITFTNANGTGDGTVSFNLTTNNGGQRSGTIAVAGQLFSLTQLNVVSSTRGDFNADGKPDLVLRNYSSGANAVWLMNGTAFQSITDLPALPNTGYRIEGTADFNADAKTDILFRNEATGQNALWLMNGTALQAIGDLPALPNPAFHFEGTGDFNADGKTDIILRNTTTGANALWLMNGTALQSIVDLPALPDTNFRFESSGDFNNDGKSDIVLRNYSTGANAIWLMNGTALQSIVDLPALPNTQYRFEAIGDFNADGKSDIVVRNYSNGANAIWLMNGTALQSVSDLPTIGNTTYEINGPR